MGSWDCHSRLELQFIAAAGQVWSWIRCATKLDALGCLGR
jgi:hypothetical protein